MTRKISTKILSHFRVKNELAREFLAEAIGIFYLVTFGCASCASNVFSSRKDPSTNSQLSIDMSFGFGATLAIVVSGKISGKFRS